MSDYEPRYLAGVLLFNDGAFFEAHEVWESLWLESSGEAKRFYQGLIQAAVCLLHLSNRNYRGAARLFESARSYMMPYRPVYLGLDIDEFWQQMEQTCRAYLNTPNPPRDEPGSYPQIRLRPEPEHWPEPEDLLPDSE
jgi:predicted metal-dependent hydrolase